MHPLHVCLFILIYHTHTHNLTALDGFVVVLELLQPADLPLHAPDLRVEVEREHQHAHPGAGEPPEGPVRPRVLSAEDADVMGGGWGALVERPKPRSIESDFGCIEVGHRAPHPIHPPTHLSQPSRLAEAQPKPIQDGSARSALPWDGAGVGGCVWWCT